MKYLLSMSLIASLTWDVAAVADVTVKRGNMPNYTLPLDPVVSLGGGVDGFLTGRARDTFGPGPSWNLRVGILDKQDLRFELVYTGSSQPVIGQGDRWLVAHGIHGLLRINFVPGHAWEPFFYVGGGWVRFHASDAMIADLQSPDHVLEIPFGLGVARRFGPVVLDARGGVSVMSGADLLPRAQSSNATENQTLHRFGLHANIGIAL